MLAAGTPVVQSFVSAQRCCFLRSKTAYVLKLRMRKSLKATSVRGTLAGSLGKDNQQFFITAICIAIWTAYCIGCWISCSFGGSRPPQHCSASGRSSWPPRMASSPLRLPANRALIRSRYLSALVNQVRIQCTLSAQDVIGSRGEETLQHRPKEHQGQGQG